MAKRFKVGDREFDNPREAFRRINEILAERSIPTTVWLEDHQAGRAYPSSNYCQRSGMPQPRPLA